MYDGHALNGFNQIAQVFFLGFGGEEEGEGATDGFSSYFAVGKYAACD